MRFRAATDGLTVTLPDGKVISCPPGTIIEGLLQYDLAEKPYVPKMRQPHADKMRKPGRDYEAPAAHHEDKATGRIEDGIEHLDRAAARINEARLRIR